MNIFDLKRNIKSLERSVQDGKDEIERLEAQLAEYKCEPPANGDLHSHFPLEEKCSQCQLEGGPSHNGSPACESGSIASGGKYSHCSCDVCF